MRSTILLEVYWLINQLAQGVEISEKEKSISACNITVAGLIFLLIPFQIAIKQSLWTLERKQVIIQLTYFIFLFLVRNYDKKLASQNMIFTDKELQFFIFGVLFCKNTKYIFKRQFQIVSFIKNTYILISLQFDYYIIYEYKQIIGKSIFTFFFIILYLLLLKSKLPKKKLEETIKESPKVKVMEKVEQFKNQMPINSQDNIQIESSPGMIQKKDIHLQYNEYFQNNMQASEQIQNSNYSLPSFKFEQIIQQFSDGIVILTNQGEMIYKNDSVSMFLNTNKEAQIQSNLFGLQNCYKEYKEQTKVSSIFNCLTKKLNTKSKELKVIQLDDEILQFQEEIVNYENEVKNNYEKFYSTKQSLGEEFQSIIANLNNQINSPLDSFDESIQFKFEVNMLCTEGGKLKTSYSSYNLELDSSVRRKHYLFKITLKPFIYKHSPYVLCVIKDVTLQNQIQILQTINDNKSQMLYQVAHEFRTPLNCIILLVKNLIKELEESVKKKYLNPILSSAESLLNLINDLLDLSQLKAGKFNLVLIQFDLGQFLNEIYNLMLQNIELKNNKLQVLLDDELDRLMISDLNRIRQILLNLISNANKYTSEGTITLEVVKKNHHTVTFSVTDTGFGIESEDQQKLFRAFGKLEKGSELNTQGVGLGLMISNLLAEKLGHQENCSSGSINVGLRIYSEGRNKGTSFYFDVVNHKNVKRKSYDTQRKRSSIESHFFKLESRSECQLRKDKVVFQLPSVRRSESEMDALISSQGIIRVECSCVKVLIVDDEIFNILALRQSLGPNPFEFDIALNGKEAVEKVMQFTRSEKCRRSCRSYKTILMDVEMPIMGGIEATQQIRSLPHGTSIYIIGCSGHSEEYIKGLENNQMDSYIAKPIKIDDLRRMIKV